MNSAYIGKLNSANPVCSANSTTNGDLEKSDAERAAPAYHRLRWWTDIRVTNWGTRGD